MSGICGIVGAVDGTYVPIKAPVEKPEVYINRKCFHTVTLQAICNHRLQFMNCFSGYPSSVSDIRIFRNSGIYDKMLTSYQMYFDNGQFIISDKAYPTNDFCISPYIERADVTEEQLHFNSQHAKSRQVIERSFALLFGRFCYLDMNRLDLIPFTITAACVLHNWCIDEAEVLQIYMDEGRTFMREHGVMGDPQGSFFDREMRLVNSSAAGMTLRDDIAHALNAG
jgi:hypothetical protein